MPRGAAVLEIGTGQGAVGARLARAFDYTGIEVDERSCEVARQRLDGRGRLLNCDWAELPEAERFDLVCAFEVLEHIEDDKGALDAWVSRLRPGGMLLLSTPLHQHRFGPWDEQVGHYRRYSREGLEELLRGAALTDIAVTSYGFPLGYALEPVRNAIARRRQRTQSMQERTAASGRSLQPSRPWVGPATRAATAPFRLAQRPFAGTQMGTGVVAAGRRAG